MLLDVFFPLHVSYFRSFGDFFLVQRFGGRVHHPKDRKSWELEVGPKNDVQHGMCIASSPCSKSSSCSSRPQVEISRPLKNPGLAPVNGLRGSCPFSKGVGWIFPDFFGKPFVVQVLDHPPWKASDLKANPPTGQIRMGNSQSPFFGGGGGNFFF